MLVFEKTIKPTRKEIVETRKEFLEICSQYLSDEVMDKYGIKITFDSRLTALREIYGEDNEITIKLTKRMNTLILETEYKGENKDMLLDPESPFEDMETYDELEINRKILKYYGMDNRQFKYSRNTKKCSIIIKYSIRKIKNKMMVEILASLALAIATALLLNFASDSTVSLINEGMVTPLFNKITTVIGKVASVLVFISVIDGITGVGSRDVIRNTGGRFLSNMFLDYIIAAISLSVIASLVYGISSAAHSSSDSIVNQVFTLVLDMIPDDMLQAFIDGNDLSLIVLAIFIGFVLLIMGESVKSINDSISLISSVINRMMSIVCKLIPLLVYLGILKMMLTDLSGLERIYKVFIIWGICVVILLTVQLIRVKLIVKQPIGRLFKKQLATTMINLATSSQVAALSENYKCCIEKFGIKKSFANYTLPLGMVTYMPCGAAFLGVLAWGTADIAGMPIDMSSVIIIAIVAVIIAIAAPPIPGSAFAVMPIIFSVCGVPLDYYPIAILLGTVIGYFLPVLNGYMLQLNLLITAKQLDIVDEELLESEPN